MTGSPKFIGGVDPGLQGAICAYNAATGDLVTFEMPVLEKPISGKKTTRTVLDEANVLATFQFLADMGVRKVYVEQVGGRPGQSGSAAFSFGHGYGAVLMAIRACGMSIEKVTPQVWKLAMRAPKDKGMARGRASDLLPAHAHKWKLKRQDGVAEAALIAMYGSKKES